MSTGAIPTGPNLATFLAAFGEPEAVRREVEEYWRTGGSPYPNAVFAYLMDKKVAQKAISEERAKFLTAYFAESFNPEPTTRYISKHREPLIREFVDWYVEKSSNPIFRIEADIMNLGGLNKALTAIKPEYKHLADSVIRLMSNVVREHLEPFGEICPIRSGGDELGIFLRANDPAMDISRINAALKNAQHEIAIFIQSAGLTDVAHSKEAKEPGVGIGCAAIKLEPGQSKTSQDAILQAGIVEAKKAFHEDHLGVLKGVALNPTNIIGLFEHNEYKRHAEVRKTADSAILREQKEFPGSSPEAARISRLERHMASIAPYGTPTETEQSLLRATSALTIKRDHVTGLPWFRDMKRDLIPNFLAQPGTPDNKKITLVHFDFNNMGGGNALGSWVGDAMARQFASCLQEALAEFKEGPPKDEMGAKPQMGQMNTAGKFLHYLTAQGGGKFALLLPAGTERTALYKLQSAVEQKLTKRWNEPLPLTEEEFTQSQRLMQESGTYPQADKMTEIKIGDICSLKQPDLKGAQVMASFIEIDGKAPHMGSAIEMLEKTIKREEGKRDKTLRERGRMVKAYVVAEGAAQAYTGAAANWQNRTAVTVSNGIVR